MKESGIVKTAAAEYELLDRIHWAAINEVPAFKTSRRWFMSLGDLRAPGRAWGTYVTFYLGNPQ